MRLEGLAVGDAYGRAAWRLWADTANAQPAAAWLEGVAAAFAAKPAALRVLQHPGIGAEERALVVAALCKAVGGDADLGRFLALVVDNGKIEHLEAIAIAYRELADGRARIRRGVLETARPLPPGRLDAFAAALGAGLGGEVVLESRVSLGLIGGFRLVLGREMVDASVAHGLKELRAALAGVGG